MFGAQNKAGPWMQRSTARGQDTLQELPGDRIKDFTNLGPDLLEIAYRLLTMRSEHRG